MPARPGQPKADAGRHQSNPKGKPKVAAVKVTRPAPKKRRVKPKGPTIEPRYSTYDQPKPAGSRFDKAAAQHAVDFISNLKHYSGAKFKGQPFLLMPWQDRLVREMFGWKRPDGKRLYRKVYVEVARKAGKTALGAAIGLYLAYGDDEPAAQVFFAASDKDQAAYCYGAARIMAEQDETLGPASVFYNSTKQILIPDNPGAMLRCLSSDTKKVYGLNLHGLIFDELMTQPNRVLWDALTTAQGAREQPMIVSITTAGWDRQSVAYEHHDYTRQIAEGTAADPTFLGVVYGASDDDDWTKPETWVKANPSLGVTVPLDYYEQKCHEAESQPTAQNAFQTLLLCQWVGQQSRLIPMAQWDASAGVVDPASLVGRRCFGGMDLSSTLDLSAFVLVFPDEDGGVTLLPQIFVPEEALRDRSLRDNAAYFDWVRDGWMTKTPGNAIDYPTVRAAILKAAEAYELVDVSYDRWGATQLVQELEEDGLDMLPLGQGFASMSAPTKEMLRLIALGKFRHGGHPVLKMMADRVAGQTDPAGNVKLAKDKSTGRIDGLVAAVMGLDGVMRRGNTQPAESVYATRGPDDFWADDEEAL